MKSVNLYYPLSDERLYEVTLIVGNEQIVKGGCYKSSYVFEGKKDELYLVLLPNDELASMHMRLMIPMPHGFGGAHGSNNNALEIADLFTSSTELEKTQKPKIGLPVMLSISDGDGRLFFCDSLRVDRYYNGTLGEDDTRICAWDVAKNIYISLGDHLFI